MQLLVSTPAAGKEAGAAMSELADVGVINAVVFLGTAAKTLTKLAIEDVSNRYSRKFTTYQLQLHYCALSIK